MEYQNLLVPWRNHVASWWRCISCGKSSEDLCKVVHNLIPLSRKGFLENFFKRMSYCIIFLIICHEFWLGLVWMILQRLNWFESQLLIPRSCWGHAQRKINEEQITLIPLICISEKKKLINKINTINTEIWRIKRISSEQYLLLNKWNKLKL